MAAATTSSSSLSASPNLPLAFRFASLRFACHSKYSFCSRESSDFFITSSFAPGLLAHAPFAFPVPSSSLPSPPITLKEAAASINVSFRFSRRSFFVMSYTVFAFQLVFVFVFVVVVVAVFPLSFRPSPLAICCSRCSCCCACICVLYCASNANESTFNVCTKPMWWFLALLSSRRFKFGCSGPSTFALICSYVKFVVKTCAFGCKNSSSFAFLATADFGTTFTTDLEADEESALPPLFAAASKSSIPRDDDFRASSFVNAKFATFTFGAGSMLTTRTLLFLSLKPASSPLPSFKSSSSSDEEELA